MFRTIFNLLYSLFLLKAHLFINLLRSDQSRSDVLFLSVMYGCLCAITQRINTLVCLFSACRRSCPDGRRLAESRQEVVPRFRKDYRRTNSCAGGEWVTLYGINLFLVLFLPGGNILASYAPTFLRVVNIQTLNLVMKRECVYWILLGG